MCFSWVSDLNSQPYHLCQWLGCWRHFSVFPVSSQIYQIGLPSLLDNTSKWFVSILPASILSLVHYLLPQLQRLSPDRIPVGHLLSFKSIIALPTELVFQNTDLTKSYYCSESFDCILSLMKKSVKNSGKHFFQINVASFFLVLRLLNLLLYIKNYHALSRPCCLQEHVFIL